MRRWYHLVCLRVPEVGKGGLGRENFCGASGTGMSDGSICAGPGMNGGTRFVMPPGLGLATTGLRSRGLRAELSRAESSQAVRPIDRRSAYHRSADRPSTYPCTRSLASGCQLLAIDMKGYAPKMRPSICVGGEYMKKCKRRRILIEKHENEEAGKFGQW